MNELPKPGDRVLLLRFQANYPDAATIDGQGLVRDPLGDVMGVDDNVRNPPGLLGTCVETNVTTGQIYMNWDNGSRLALMIGFDSWELHDGLLCVLCRHLGLDHDGEHLVPKEHA